MTGYADPHALVSTDWLKSHLEDESLVIVEVDADTTAYDSGHIPGAIAWNWTQLSDERRRDILSPSQIEALLGKSGISNTTAVVLYGDHHNWFATWAFWQLKIYGHRNLRLLDGGRGKWVSEKKPLTKDVAVPQQASYRAQELNLDLRALLPQVKVASKTRSASIIDVRTLEEFTGQAASPAGEAAVPQRAGHIPGARCVPWAMTCNDDGTFKSADVLRELFASKGITPDRDVITYCAVGDRASHTWFVLKHLLGYPGVKNYDGSWAEWGNLVGVAIETGEERLPRERTPA